MLFRPINYGVTTVLATVTERKRLHVLAIQLSSYGTVTFANHMAIPVSGRVAYEKNGLSELATADAAVSSLKAAEPQAYSVCFAKRRSVKLGCHLVQCMTCGATTV